MTDIRRVLVMTLRIVSRVRRGALLFDRVTQARVRQHLTSAARLLGYWSRLIWPPGRECALWWRRGLDSDT